MSIPFLDLGRQALEVEAEAAAAFARVLRRGVYVLGEEVAGFEEEWAAYCGARACAGVGNGTDALSLALVASGAVRPGQGDEVVTAPLTAAYTALAILNAGGVPAFADIDPETYTLDPRALEAAITPRTRAVVPVHLYGRPADMEAITEVARRHGLLVIEDAAQAHGARLGGRRAGTLAAAAAFSFYPTKNLGALGDGGAVVSDDEALIERVKLLRQGGHAAALRGTAVGRNSRLDELQAALLRVKLRRLDRWHEERQALSALYRGALAGTRLQLPAPGGGQVHHLFVVGHPERDRLRDHLAARGVETAVHYPYLLHEQPLFRRPGQRALPAAERAAPHLLSLPLHPHLSPAEARLVIEAILEFEGMAHG